MEKNCSNCKFSQGNDWHEQCDTCNVNSEEGTKDNYQRLKQSYTREQVLELIDLVKTNTFEHFFEGKPYLRPIDIIDNYIKSKT